MRINRVSIKNFKCFKSLDIDFGKLTLMTGANSSGKSSILYSILGALQSSEFPFNFSPNGKYVNMGNFREMSYKHLEKNTIEIGLVIDDNDHQTYLTTWWEEDRLRKLPQLKKLEFDSGAYTLEISKKIKYTAQYKVSPKNDLRIGIKPGDLIETLLNRFPGKVKILPGKDINGSKNDNVKKNNSNRHVPQLKKLKKSATFTFGNFNEFENWIHTQDDMFFVLNMMRFTKIYKDLDDQLNFISSFRLYPERTYYETTKTNLKIGKFGEDYINQVILWETQDKNKYKELIKIMKSLSLFEDISSRRLEGGRFEIVVKINKSSVPASLNDVGFGISQFLPIIVSDLQLENGSTLFVAQPEIHLHPSVQAQFGSYMVNQINRLEKNYIIETHSEYLLNRIRLAIVKKEIPKDDVKIYFLQNDGEDVQTHRLEFTTDGKILNAPEDFFKTYQMDVMNIAMSADGE